MYLLNQWEQSLPLNKNIFNTIYFPLKNKIDPMIYRSKLPHVQRIWTLQQTLISRFLVLLQDNVDLEGPWPMGGFWYGLKAQWLF